MVRTVFLNQGPYGLHVSPQVIASKGLIFLNGGGAQPGTNGSMGRTGLPQEENKVGRKRLRNTDLDITSLVEAKN